MHHERLPLVAGHLEVGFTVQFNLPAVLPEGRGVAQRRAGIKIHLRAIGQHQLRALPQRDVHHVHSPFGHSSLPLLQQPIAARKGHQQHSRPTGCLPAYTPQPVGKRTATAAVQHLVVGQQHGIKANPLVHQLPAVGFVFLQPRLDAPLFGLGGLSGKEFI